MQPSCTRTFTPVREYDVAKGTPSHMVPNSVRLIDQGSDPEDGQHEDACGAEEDSWASGWIVSGAAVALVALAVGLVGPAWSASGDDGKVRTFRSEALSTEHLPQVRGCHHREAGHHAGVPGDVTQPLGCGAADGHVIQ